MHRSAFARIFKTKPELRSRRVDELTVADVADSGRRARGRRLQARDAQEDATALAQTLDFYG